MKELYLSPEMEVVLFSAVDVIATSFTLYPPPYDGGIIRPTVPTYPETH